MRPSERVLARAIEHRRAGRLALERSARLAPLLSQMPLTFCGAVPLDREPTPLVGLLGPRRMAGQGAGCGSGDPPHRAGSVRWWKSKWHCSESLLNFAVPGAGRG